MYERFNADARQVVVRAQDEARALRHASVGTEHLLLGLLGLEDSTGARALRSLGLTHEQARADVERAVAPSEAVPHGSIPFVPRLRRTLDVAMQEAMSLGHDEVGTEHLVLAMTSDLDSVAGRILEQVAERGVVRDAVLEAMATPPDGDGDGAAPAASGPPVDVPRAVTVAFGEDAHAVLRRAAALALGDGAPAVGVEHLRRALEG